ncbi:MAG: TetR/AcrR family transcriptional regulator [Hyphomonadaceae bacterium]
MLERTTDIFIDGLALKGASWCSDAHPVAAAPRAVSSDLSLEDFLAAATQLINKFGHRGASVEKISAELNVTKGSFYHHNEAKGDLVESCFMRTHDIMKETQRRAMDESATQWDALTRAVNTLVDYQVSPAGPLLRTSILPTLPEPMRTKLTERLNRVVERFAAIISDGIAEGSIRAIDPAIAAQMFKVAINATADAPSWVRGVTREVAPALYAKPALFGALAR